MLNHFLCKFNDVTIDAWINDFFFRHYNFKCCMFWPSQHIICSYCDPGCS